MYYGELKEQTLDYQRGHIVGGRRMARFLIAEFKKVCPSKTAELTFLKKAAEEWHHHCLTFGYGQEEPADAVPLGINENFLEKEATKNLTLAEEIIKAHHEAEEATKRAELAEAELAKRVEWLAFLFRDVALLLLIIGILLPAIGTWLWGNTFGYACWGLIGCGLLFALGYAYLRSILREYQQSQSTDQEG